MAMSDEQLQAIREEEVFRHQVRLELAGPPPRSGFIERISAFFETKTGFWLLTTVLAGLSATAISEFQRYTNRDVIARTEAAERARRDMDTVLKLGPMLTSNERTQVNMAIVLLNGLTADHAMDSQIGLQVTALVNKTLSDGLKADASPAEKVQAEAIISFADSARTAANRGALSASQVATQGGLAAAIDAQVLPARVYLQISKESDRPRAAQAAKAIRQAGLIVPGIELVPSIKAPSINDLRYCESKVDPNTLAQLTKAVNDAVTPAPKVVILNSSQCAKVRFNHFEVWYAQ
ncbi:hypothetical protein E5284_08170 [Citrobacter freundii]|jgi:hypothetical protein|uniref:hypothetical protein n=1 Tax=Citrobacter freundii TaxID=546 RepID=UPI001093E2EC|nr:hypothetical protein [Citrobacter freundii]QCA17850.1 hypothetical protein E5284_08170 [Citrobacter freundii]QLS05587.1 hypothetical protein HV327_08260 [Citrobacter freundii]